MDTDNSRHGNDNAYRLAEIHADARDLDATFERLKVTGAIRDPLGVRGLVMPYFDDARKDPRWPEFKSAFKL